MSMPMRTPLFILALALSSAASADHVWWEGEKPHQTNFPKDSWFSPHTFADRRDQLSGGDWLSSSGKRGQDELFARYRVTIPADGQYAMWARKFWKHGPFRWRFDDGPWQICGRDVALADDTHLRKFVNANWVSLGKLTLTKGEHLFELRLLAAEGEEATAAFDCFVLARGPFIPNGRLKPGERSGRADEGFFAFEPPADDFRDSAMLDLRALNEKTAGESGFPSRSGDSLVLGNGKPVRFWAVNVGLENARQDPEAVDYLARRLAKLGVNMVRFHGSLSNINAPDRIDQSGLAALHYLVAALKQQGIYTAISFYFPLWHEVTEGSGIPGYDTIQNKKPFALLFFDPRFQEIYRGWARLILTARNPHTGLSLAQDPAVGIVEIVNEDSFFFWTFAKSNVPLVHWRKLETMFGQWLTKRYGSLDKAIRAWDGTTLRNDDLAARRMELVDAWGMAAAGLKGARPGKVRRTGDQVRFLAELQRDFYASMRAYFRNELKVGGLVSASNWTVSDRTLLDAIERWTYTATDVIDQHGYFSGEHKGEGASYSVRVGHTYKDRAAVASPDDLPLRCAQVAGYPQIVSEIGFTNPNRFRADAMLLSAACASVQGIDGIFHFAIGSNYMMDTTLRKFGLCSPAIAGTFPAAALLYRRGDVRQADPVLTQSLNLDDLFAMKGSGAWSADALDDLRKTEVPGGTPAAVGRVDPLTPYVGPVVRKFAGEPASFVQADLPRLIDRSAGRVRSLTGEVDWDYQRGVIRVNTPKSQGAAGFLKSAGSVQLADIAIDCENEFASVAAVSLDDRPIASARRVFVQIMTEERPLGFRTDGDTIADLGQWPFGVRKVRAALTIKWDGAVKVAPLDENGYTRTDTVSVKSQAGSTRVHLLADCLYYVMTR